ncbi:MAG: mannose-1-phosphate guanylyltransferase [Thermaerobacter sp.]|nr:mannose-1-phosphate guanylyltransferase [Thermaerobacter sp.]MDA8144865.1 mannose-1-phosphate guanylyltransferase [Thermaerobacter sp.]
MDLVALIMAGGKGERFWPKSRRSRPKQFLPIVGKRTMLQETVHRISSMVPRERVFISTSEEYRELVEEQLPWLKPENLILEPEGRDTAACVGYASLIIRRCLPEAVTVVLPADHHITDVAGFLRVLRLAAQWAARGDHLVTIGIEPTGPETGYGYIERGEPVEELEGLSVFAVGSFREKPDRATAAEYLATGRFLWNSGMFLWRTELLLAMLERHLPELYRGLEAIDAALDTPRQDAVVREIFCALPRVSIDYGLLEHAAQVLVVPGDFGWDDVGTWTAVERLHEHDENGNLISGRGVAMDTRNCILESSGRLVAALGVEDLIIVDTEDVVMVSSKDKAQEIKRLLSELSRNNLQAHL